MRSITLFATLTGIVVSAVSGLTINSPADVTECQPTQFSWSGGTAPYYFTLVPAGQTSAPAIKIFPTQQGTSFTWNVDLASGTSFTGELKDGSGNLAFTSIITIVAGSDSSCVNTSVQDSGTGGTASGSGSSGNSGSTAAATATAAGTTGSSGSSSSATSTASGSSSTQSSAAGRLSLSSAVGVAGLVGLVGAAFF